MIKKTIKKIVPAHILRSAKISFLEAREVVRTTLLPARKIMHRVIRTTHPPKIPRNTDGKVLIHLGCADQNNKRFINIDTEPYPHVHYVQNVRNLSVFPENFADLIYASHVFEHISHLELDATLKEWARVLKHGATLRLSVPDFDILIHVYHSSGNNIDTIKDALMGGQTYEDNFHRAVFNEKYLSRLLEKAGFHNVRRWDASKNEYGFTDFARTFKGSLNLEADKM